MTISPTLLKQFNVLVNLAVFINMVPYVLALTALGIIMKNADVNQKEYNNGIIIGSVAVLYSIYGAYSTGEEAVFYGAIITLLGYFFYGFIASRETVNNKVSS